MLGHKTAKKADERTAFMPLLALGHTLEDDPWAAAWMAARTRMGMDDLEVVMPAYAEQSRSWLARPMTSAEGCAWLQEILCENGMEPEEVKDLTTHSLKATPLSWATKSGHFSKDEKRVLGHHAAPDEKMIVTYGRDVMTPVLAKLQHLVDAIRSDQFDPDLPRAARLSTLVQKLRRLTSCLDLSVGSETLRNLMNLSSPMSRPKTTTGLASSQAWCQTLRVRVLSRRSRGRTCGTGFPASYTPSVPLPHS